MSSKDRIIQQIEELSPWGQIIRLTEDLYTPGSLDTEYRWDFMKNLFPKNFKGMKILDIGCNAGFFSLKMKELGAQYVLGIDFQHYINQAKFIAEIKKCKDVEFKVQSVYKLSNTSRFNLTLCLGVLYHLKYPFLALRKISEVTSEMLLLDIEVLVDAEDTDKMKFIEHTYRNDGTNWWLFGEECLKGMLRNVGFKFVKSYSYPYHHPTFGDNYYQGLTEEGMKKGKRIVVVALKTLDPARIGILLSESSDLENEIDLKNLNLDE